MKFFPSTKIFLFLVVATLLLSPFGFSVSGTVSLQQKEVRATHGPSLNCEDAYDKRAQSAQYSGCLQAHDLGPERNSCGLTDFACHGGKLAITIMGWSAKATQMGGNLLDTSIYYSLHLGGNKGIEAGVEAGWETFRDLANLVFIFVLLYISIATILQLPGPNRKDMLMKLIVIGLLLNFSLFATKVVIDMSNVLGCGFYEKTANKPCGEGGSGGYLSFTDDKSGIAFEFMQHTNPQSLWDTEKLDGKSAKEIQEFYKGGNILTIGIFGTLFLLVLAFVFFMGAILFIMRSVALLFLMVVSPLAFIGFIVPYTAGYAKQWWNKVFSYSFLAPVFLVLIFASNKIMEGVSKAIEEGEEGDFTFVEALSTLDAGPVGVIFNFLLAIGLVVAAFIISKQWGDHLGSGAVKLAQRSTRFAGKNTLGALGTGVRSFGDQRRKAGKGGLVTSGSRSIGNFLESRSYDVGKVPGADKAGMSELKDSKNVFQTLGAAYKKVQYSKDDVKEDYDAAKGPEEKQRFFEGLSEANQEKLYKQMSASERAELRVKDEEMRKRLDGKLSEEDRGKTEKLRKQKSSREATQKISNAVRNAEENNKDVAAAVRDLAKKETGEKDLDKAMKKFVGKISTDDVAKIDTKAISEEMIKGMSKMQFRKLANESRTDEGVLQSAANVYKNGSNPAVSQEIQFGENKAYRVIQRMAEEAGGESLIVNSTNVESALRDRDNQQ